MSIVCGAKTRSGAPCKSPALAGKKRCRLHGGASNGAPKGNKNSMKHGIYSRVIREEDQEAFEECKSALGTLDQEIALVRLQLRNTVAAMERVRAEGGEDPHGAGLELQKFVDKDQTEFTAGPEKHYERVDYNAHIDRLTARIQSLEKTRAELLEAEAKRREGEDPDGDEAPKWEITIVPAKTG